MTLEGYCSATSVFAGDDIDFHVSSASPGERRMQIRRLPSVEVVHTAVVDVASHETPAHANERGCGWPTSYTLTVPDQWPSGVYRVDFEEPGAADGSVVAERPEQEPARGPAHNPLQSSPSLHFVVKARPPTSPILFSVAVATHQAYNHWPAPEWPGGSLYFSDGPARSHQVSFLRPGGWPFYYRWEGVFVDWLDREQVSCDFCTSVDLHRDPDLLSRYQLLVSVGHDEYWSKEMRDHVEGFVARGGNVAFFSGDVCTWQARIEDDATTVVCHKNAVEDPLDGLDAERVTIQWSAPPVSRPPNTMTGVRHSAMYLSLENCDQPREDAAYTVRFPDHWVFDDVALAPDGTFGRGENIVGYETDGCRYVEIDGVPRATGADGTPESFVILATADLTGWDNCGHGGYATVGIHRRNGAVFTAATTDWSHGLLYPDSAVHQITRNVLRRLSEPVAGDWEPAGDAADITAMTGVGTRLVGVSRDGVLRSRDAVAQNAPWREIGAGEELVAMCSISGQLFAADRNGRLLWREAATELPGWEAIGDAGIEITALAAAHFRLFAVAKGDLWCREVTREVAEWVRIGDAPGITTLAARGAAVFGATEDGALMWRPPIGDARPSTTGPMGGMRTIWHPERTDASWEPVGHVPGGVVALAAVRNRMFVATQDGRLWSREGA